jgi:hypothetical protein
MLETNVLGVDAKYRNAVLPGFFEPGSHEEMDIRPLRSQLASVVETDGSGADDGDLAEFNGSHRASATSLNQGTER